MNYIIREINENETAVLEDFLYEAIFCLLYTSPSPRDCS